MVFSKRYVFEVDPFSVASMSDRHDVEKYSSQISRRKEHISKHMANIQQNHRLFRERCYGLDNVYYDRDDMQELTVQELLDTGKNLQHYHLNNVPILLGYRPSVFPLLNDANHQKILELHQTFKAKRDAKSYDFECGMVFLHAPSAECLAACIFSSNILGSEERSFSDEHLATREEWMKDYPKTYHVSIFELTIHCLKWSTNIATISSENLRELQEHFYKSIVQYILHGEIILVCTYDPSIDPADILIFERIYGLTAGRGEISAKHFRDRYRID
jgi:hypothetical protein